jgi:NTE family protein
MQTWSAVSMEYPATMAAANQQGAKIGLVLSGGGARGAYQVGVLRAIAHLLPRRQPIPFKIICGTSAGAINAASLASHAGDFQCGVARLARIWGSLRTSSVYRSDFLSVAGNSFRWLGALFVTGFARSRPTSMLDNAPLAKLLERRIEFARIAGEIDAGNLDAVCVTASGYASGQSISFYQGKESLAPWSRVRRAGYKTQLQLPHLMGSAAIPFVFPPVWIEHEHFGDGSMEQLAPISPALHLGADRVLVIKVGDPTRHIEQSADASKQFPSLAQVAGRVLDSIFLDSLDMDLERLARINTNLDLLPRDIIDHHTLDLRHVDTLVIAPSQRMADIALEHTHAMPWAVRSLMRGIGALRPGGGNVLSYLLFERSYCRALMKMGWADAMAKKAAIIAFLGAGK